MIKKKLNGLTMECPVPPWSPKNIVKLAQYLGVSQAKITEMLGISYSALRAWIDGRSKSISQNILSRLKRFESKIPHLRLQAEERFGGLVEKEERRKARLPKPWPANRIRSFMHTWGMSQIEFAIFAGVSYDTVTSWSRGRRRLVRRDTAEHIEWAEKVAKERGFSPATSESKENPWSPLRKFQMQEIGPRSSGEIPTNCIETFALQVIEKFPGEFRVAKSSETLVISARKKKEQLVVELTIGKKLLKFEGIWRKLAGVKVIELKADPDDESFFSDRGGCIIPSRNLLRVSLWSPKDLPLRFTAAC